MTPRKVIIDCDTGVDDAMALSLALRSPELEVVGITCVAGNVELEHVIRNTLTVVELSGKNVPVYAGAYRPLMGAWETAASVHGRKGFGDLEYPEPKISVEPEHAVDFLVRAFLESQDDLDLITIGPLTNVALALAKDARLASKIRSITMMAGGINAGNSTPAAEFNIYADPEAADLVFRSGIPLTMIALDPIVECGGIYVADVEDLEAAVTPWCTLVARLLRRNLERMKVIYGDDLRTTPPDLLAVGVYIDPSIADCEMFHVTVECRGEHTRGMTLLDRRMWARAMGLTAQPNVNVVKTVDNLRYRALVVDTLTAH